MSRKKATTPESTTPGSTTSGSNPAQPAPKSASRVMALFWGIPVVLFILMTLAQGQCAR